MKSRVDFLFFCLLAIAIVLFVFIASDIRNFDDIKNMMGFKYLNFYDAAGNGVAGIAMFPFALASLTASVIFAIHGERFNKGVLWVRAVITIVLTLIALCLFLLPLLNYQAGP
ncbi:MULTISPECIES: hypothetical protein [Paraburkholderia]|uniref:hypothetical protein n=1 Tax=Paraburkholderia TaxID=1822464 RepID=UPI0022534DBD|nr:MULTISPECIES: hypothetical protein [Paraburkholderia]MCX4163680.1 hypothetical protein [Paraburkholderia megapolitana]MDN7159175.1 hypothetical protein [Paraburkholderia sp. CHISQ3]MDQ6496222.1 hypothetical protein [Paraburkholderia megapolitana]